MIINTLHTLEIIITSDKSSSLFPNAASEEIDLADQACPQTHRARASATPWSPDKGSSVGYLSVWPEEKVSRCSDQKLFMFFKDIFVSFC